jgi:hypothetical protein
VSSEPFFEGNRWGNQQMRHDREKQKMNGTQLDLFGPKHDQAMSKGQREWNKCDILKKLHAIAVAHLFGDCPWLSDRETCGFLSRLSFEMKLWESCRGSDSMNDTALGRELNLRLFEVFMGVWEPWEIPDLLRQNGFT